MAYNIDQSKCIGCHTCMGICPMMAIAATTGDKCAIDPAKCVSCGTCASVCPVSAIAQG